LTTVLVSITDTAFSAVGWVTPREFDPMKAYKSYQMLSSRTGGGMGRRGTAADPLSAGNGC